MGTFGPDAIRAGWLALDAAGIFLLGVTPTSVVGLVVICGALVYRNTIPVRTLFGRPAQVTLQFSK